MDKFGSLEEARQLVVHFLFDELLLQACCEEPNKRGLVGSILDQNTY